MEQTISFRFSKGDTVFRVVQNRRPSGKWSVQEGTVWEIHIRSDGLIEFYCKLNGGFNWFAFFKQDECFALREDADTAAAQKNSALTGGEEE